MTTDDYKDLEKELWSKIGEALGDNRISCELDVVDFIHRWVDQDFFDNLDNEDLILGLSGIEPDAVDRMKKRRENIKKFRDLEKQKKIEDEKSLKKYIEQQEKIFEDTFGKLLKDE